MFALPFYPPDAEEDAAPQGALVTVADASAQRADHRRLTWVVSGGCALLVLLSAGVGHLLSGRAVRPALEALDRQESFLATPRTTCARGGLAADARRDRAAR
ncbi:hypothetical protein LUR56_08085 [Streptomyces sp. MT29]|nr:hypothetical protein [Streptomyces sp. MT29]